MMWCVVFFFDYRCKDSDIRVRRDDVSREQAMLSVENQRVR